MHRKRAEFFKNDQRRRFDTGMLLNRTVRNLDSCIQDLQNVLPLQPQNREISIILENLRENKRRLTEEYSRRDCKMGSQSNHVICEITIFVINFTILIQD